jgi:hypothetical protein
MNTSEMYLPTYRGPTTQTVLKRLKPYSLFKSGHIEDHIIKDLLYEFIDDDTKESLDLYTRGMYDLELHYDSLNKYNFPIEREYKLASTLHKSKHLEVAYETFIKEIECVPSQFITPTDKIDEIEYVPSSAAGFGYEGIKRDNYFKARHNATRALYDYRKHRTNYRFVPDKAYARTQLAMRDKPKIRHVWGRAFHNILIEGLVGQKLFREFQLHNTPLYIGKDLHKDLPYDIIQMLRGKWTAYCLDFSAFDSSVSGYLVALAWKVIKHKLIVTNSYEQDVVDYAEYLFRNTPVVMPDGRLFLVQTGIPSGSYFTQLIDSICNVLIIYTIQLELTGKTYPTYVMGDDSVFTLPEPSMKMEDIERVALKLGMTINKDKSVITSRYEEIIFLGHNFYGSRVTRNDFINMSLAIYAEQDVINAYHSYVRVASLLYDTGYNSYLLLRLLKILNARYKFDWTTQDERPADIYPPFTKLFVIS